MKLGFVVDYSPGCKLSVKLLKHVTNPNAPVSFLLRVDVVKSPQTKESKGFGFIKFALEEDAHRAVNGLRGKIVSGKKLRAEIARRKGGES